MTNENIINSVTAAHTDVKARVDRKQAIFCFHSVSDKAGGRLKDDHGRVVFLPLNQRHVPIGVTGWFNQYEDHVDTHGMDFECDPFDMGVVWEKNSNEHWLFVFDDDIPKSRNEYTEHMRKIMVHAKPYDGKLH
jgi:hypothetical protein